MSEAKNKALKEEERNEVVYRQFIGVNAAGEIIYDVTRKVKSQNGGGWVISYTEKMCEFLTRVSTGATVRVFLYIAHHQSYGVDGQFGYRCTHKYLRQVLNISKPTLWASLKWLKENYLVNEMEIDGATEFMVNPNYITVGTDKKARVREWSRRWELFHKRNIAASLK